LPTFVAGLETTANQKRPRQSASARLARLTTATRSRVVSATASHLPLYLTALEFRENSESAQREFWQCTFEPGRLLKLEHRPRVVVAGLKARSKCGNRFGPDPSMWVLFPSAIRIARVQKRRHPRGGSVRPLSLVPVPCNTVSQGLCRAG